MGEIFGIIILWACIAVGAFWLFKITKKHDIMKKKENNILSAISVSKKRSLSLISSSSGVDHAEVIEILEKAIVKANGLSTKKKSSYEDLENYRFLRNARIDFNKDEIILDENASEMNATLDIVTNAINKVIRGEQPKQSQSESPKDWHCSFCDAVNKGTRDKCLNCGAPSN